MPESKPKPIPQLSPADIERFHSLYRRGAPNECWPWTGTRFKNRYGRFYHYYASYKAQRIAYYLAEGDPGDLRVLHHCDNPPCVNPAHLFKGTNADNMADKVAKGRHNGWRGPHPNATGSKHCQAKLTETQVLEIKQKRLAGARFCNLARAYKVSHSLIQFIVAGKAWRHVKLNATGDTPNLPGRDMDKTPS